jgi:hypothetical protein
LGVELNSIFSVNITISLFCLWTTAIMQGYYVAAAPPQPTIIGYELTGEGVCVRVFGKNFSFIHLVARIPKKERKTHSMLSCRLVLGDYPTTCFLPDCLGALCLRLLQAPNLCLSPTSVCGCHPASLREPKHFFFCLFVLGQIFDPSPLFTIFQVQQQPSVVYAPPQAPHTVAVAVYN